MDRPYVICHMLTSLDGKIDGAFMAAPARAPALTEYGNIRNFYNCEAMLYGTTTMAGGYSNGLVGRLPHSAVSYPKEDYAAATELKNYIISVDPEGILGWRSNCIHKKDRPKAHVIEVLTKAVSDDYLAYLRSLEISSIFEKAHFLPTRKPAVFEFKGLKQIEGGSLWLRYMLKG